jgi:DNA processing protein
MSTHVGSQTFPGEGLMTQKSVSRSGPPYNPPHPDSITRITVGSLLDGKRPVIPNQQARLGFEAEGLALELWCAGDISLVQRKGVSIVGTREVSKDGAARARRLARELSEHSIVVFSGLAKGVDTEALQSAINANGRVVAVIGTPLDKAYPAENKKLQEQIYKDHLLISQFRSGQRVFPTHFPERNKLMAALSDATVIIEAGETSGTLHQAAECQRQGRWLFIAQAVIDDKNLSWPSRFINHEKCRVLRCTEDLLSVL